MPYWSRICGKYAGKGRRITAHIICDVLQRDELGEKAVGRNGLNSSIDMAQV